MLEIVSHINHVRLQLNLLKSMLNQDDNGSVKFLFEV